MTDEEYVNPDCIGDSLEDFLKEEGLYEDAHAHAVKQVMAWQITKEMKKQKLTKAKMAKRMEISCSDLDMLLDPDNDTLDLLTLIRAASVLGKELQVSLV